MTNDEMRNTRKVFTLSYSYGKIHALELTKYVQRSAHA